MPPATQPATSAPGTRPAIAAAYSTSVPPPAPVPSTSKQGPSILIWGGVLIAVVLIGYVVISAIRARLLANDAGNMDTGFSLSDLRKMVDTGQLTREEYLAAKAKMTSRLKSALSEEDKSPPEEKEI